MEDKTKEIKPVKFTWFDWVVLIASALLGLMYLFRLIFFILYGNLTLYNTEGNQDSSFILIFFWLVIFLVAFDSKWKKLKRSKASH